MSVIKVAKLCPEAELPVKKHQNDAGFDVFACSAHKIAPGGEFSFTSASTVRRTPATCVTCRYGSDLYRAADDGTTGCIFAATLAQRAGSKQSNCMRRRRYRWVISWFVCLFCAFAALRCAQTNCFLGEVRVLLFNHGNEPYTIRPGERVAQAVPICTPLNATIEEVDQPAPVEETSRGASGFGASGCL